VKDDFVHHIVDSSIEIFMTIN